MTVLGGALITDHVWLIDKRDLLKNAATAASLTATAELGRLPQIHDGRGRGDTS